MTRETADSRDDSLVFWYIDRFEEHITGEVLFVEPERRLRKFVRRAVKEIPELRSTDRQAFSKASVQLEPFEKAIALHCYGFADSALYELISLMEFGLRRVLRIWEEHTKQLTSHGFVTDLKSLEGMELGKIIRDVLLKGGFPLGDWTEDDWDWLLRLNRYRNNLIHRNTEWLRVTFEETDTVDPHGIHVFTKDHIQVRASIIECVKLWLRFYRWCEALSTQQE